MLHISGIVFSFIVHAAGHHRHEQEAQTAGQPLDSRESTVCGPSEHWEPQMTVAKVTSGSSNEKVTELREFLFAGERHETFDLQMENDIDEELGESVTAMVGQIKWLKQLIRF